jgi:hypothetical protein
MNEIPPTRQRRAARAIAIPGLLTLALLAAGTARAQVETTWLGPNGDWTDPARWSLGVPGPADTAIIGAGAGSLTLDVDRSVFGYQQAGGTLTGSGTLNVLGPASWSGGIHGGPGTTSFLGALLIDGAATRTISGPRTFVVGGVATWAGNTVQGGGNLSMTTSGGISTLRVDGEWIEAQAFDHAIQGSSAGRVEVEGRWLKLGGATTTIGPSFHNHGEVRLDAGRMRIGGGGQHSGVFDLADGAVIEFSGGTHNLGALSTTTGDGLVQVSGGTAAFDGGSHTAALLLSGGTLAGADHVHRGAATWTGGAIGGAGTTSFAGTLAIDGAAAHAINGPRTVVVDGTATWAGNTAHGNGTISMTTSGGVSTLRIGGELVEAQAFDHTIQGSSAGRVEVAGRWHKQGEAMTSVNPSLHNHGLVQVDAGRLRLAGGGEHSGLFALAEKAVLELAGGTHALAPTTAFDGAGTLHISGGTADLQSVHQSARLLVSGGTLTGGTHHFTGDATWTGGSFGGAATTTLAGATTISGSTIKQLTAGRTLVLAGDASWEGNTAAGNGTIFLGSTGGATTLRIEGTLDERQAFDPMVGGNGRLEVTGRWLKTGDTLSSFTSGVELDNRGTVEVAAGTLRVARSVTNDGVIVVHAGAIFESTCFAGGGVCFRNDGLIKGSGTVAPPATGLVNNGIIAPGHSIGTLTVDGPLTLAAGGVLQIELASLDRFDRLLVSGAATLGGELALWNAGYAPQLGDSFEVMAFGALGAGSGGFEALSWHGFGSGVAFDVAVAGGGVTVTVTAIPEPATWISLLAGLVLVGARRWQIRGRASVRTGTR